MPRVLRIINRFNLGGPTYNAAYLSRYLSDDFETLLIGGEKDKSEGSSEFIVENLGLKPLILPEMKRSIDPLKDWRALRKVRKIIKEFKPDIVHTHASKAGTIGRLAASQMGVPVVVHTFHGHVFHSYFSKTKTQVYKNIERFLARKSDRIVAISEIQKEELSAIHKICSPDKIEVVPLGFDLNRFTKNQDEHRSTFRQKYKLEEDEIAIGIIGRLVPIKNHDYFLKSIRELSSRTQKKLRVFIIGDGELKQELFELCKDLELPYTEDPNSQALINFTSWIKQVEGPCAGLDVICLSSLNEGTPVSLIEAHAAAKPVVSTNVGGIENVVLKDRSAFLSEKDDNAAFIEGLLKLVESASLREEMGNEGRKFVLERFHYTRLVDDIERLYRELLDSKSKPSL
jgi:glycosyltransferase involved in cell wall biosynthesis